MIKKTSLAVCSLVLLGLGSYNLANSKSGKTDWRDQKHCFKLQKADAPTMMSTRLIKFVGVDIGAEGEIRRLYPKPDTFKALPDNFVFAEQAKFLDGLTRKDFFHYTGPFPENYETPLDIHSNEDTSFIYILMPDSWTYSRPAMTMKQPPKKWKQPHFDFPTHALTPKVAVVHRQGMNPDSRLKCHYKFNLHVTITQQLDGRVFTTPIIIDSNGSNVGASFP